VEVVEEEVLRDAVVLLEPLGDALLLWDREALEETVKEGLGV
jgi:hypothetical protein